MVEDGSSPPHLACERFARLDTSFSSDGERRVLSETLSLISARVCAWPRAPWNHPAPSRTWSCPMAAPESTARGTAWEARPLRTLPRGQAIQTHSRILNHRGVEQWQLVGLITQRSWVRIPPPLPGNPDAYASGFCHARLVVRVLRLLRSMEQVELCGLLRAA